MHENAMLVVPGKVERHWKVRIALDVRPARRVPPQLIVIDLAPQDFGENVQFPEFSGGEWIAELKKLLPRDEVSREWTPEMMGVAEIRVNNHAPPERFRIAAATLYL